MSNEHQLTGMIITYIMNLTGILHLEICQLLTQLLDISLAVAVSTVHATKRIRGIYLVLGLEVLVALLEGLNIVHGRRSG